MTRFFTFIFLLFSLCSYSQKDFTSSYSNFVNFEFALGETFPTNTGFPELKLHKSLFLSLGKTNLDNTDEWAYRLRYPRTGLTIALTDYGNPKYMGYSFSVLSFIEYDLLKSILKGLSMQVGIGASYYTYTYKNLPYAFNNAPENNSRAVSTKVTWAYKMFLNYAFIKNKKATWKAGIGIYHQSNGHTSLPNDGLNSVLASVSMQNHYNSKKSIFNTDTDFIKNEYPKSSYYYFDFRYGQGVNVLSEELNDRNGVYSVAGSFGKIINKTFKIGIGFQYRIYGNYYNYIKDEGELVVEEYAYFIDAPFKYASNYGVFVTSELLLGHIGIEVNIGYNLYKPFYEVDFQLHQGFNWEVFHDDGTSEFVYILGELDSSYEIKKIISSRVGLKYYLFSNEKTPKNNVFIGAHINTNLGQADFTELSFGYVHSFGIKTKN